MALKDVAADYFSKINSIAARMCADMNETREAYEDLWLTLTEDEKIEILNESIIKPEICIKYSESESDDNNKNEYAVKLIVDDNYSYRDEHSAPFSFRTPSQRNLAVFTKLPDNKKKLFSKPPESKLKVLSKPPENTKKVFSKPPENTKKVFCKPPENSKKMFSASKGKEVLKPSPKAVSSTKSKEITPLLTEFEVDGNSSNSSSRSSVVSSIPKTGLDLLDNW